MLPPAPGKLRFAPPCRGLLKACFAFFIFFVVKRIFAFQLAEPPGSVRLTMEPGPRTSGTGLLSETPLNVGQNLCYPAGERQALAHLQFRFLSFSLNIQHLCCLLFSSSRSMQRGKKSNRDKPVQFVLCLR